MAEDSLEWMRLLMNADEDGGDEDGEEVKRNEELQDCTDSVYEAPTLSSLRSAEFSSAFDELPAAAPSQPARPRIQKSAKSAPAKPPLSVAPAPAATSAKLAAVASGAAKAYTVHGPPGLPKAGVEVTARQGTPKAPSGNLHQPAKVASATAAAVAEKALSVGDTVAAQTKARNGMRGTVVGFQGDRVEVQFSDETWGALKPACLKRIVEATVKPVAAHKNDGTRPVGQTQEDHEGRSWCKKPKPGEMHKKPHQFGGMSAEKVAERMKIVLAARAEAKIRLEKGEPSGSKGKAVPGKAVVPYAGAGSKKGAGVPEIRGAAGKGSKKGVARHPDAPMASGKGFAGKGGIAKGSTKGVGRHPDAPGAAGKGFTGKSDVGKGSKQGKSDVGKGFKQGTAEAWGQKRAAFSSSHPQQSLSKKPRHCNELLHKVDSSGRQYDTSTVVVNFANVGTKYGKVCLGRDGQQRDERGYKVGLLDWEGIRRCCLFLQSEKRLKIVGVIHENYSATDNNSRQRRPLPQDIRAMCESIEETPHLPGDHQKSADDEMTIKCAHRRNCYYLDNDHYRDWQEKLKDVKIREWLQKTTSFLQMRFYFDSGLGTFDLLEGNKETSA